MNKEDCKCDKRVPAGRNERGDLERCTTCGNVYLILNGEEVWLEDATDKMNEADAETQAERDAENQAELNVDETIIEKHEQRAGTDG